VTQGQTADQVRETRRAFDRSNPHWSIDIDTKEIRHRPFMPMERVQNFRWPKKHTVWELYWWLRHMQFEHPIMSALGNPINSDNMPIDGHPMECERQSGWTIPTTHLKFLKNGLLMAEYLTKILAPSSNWRSIVLGFVKQIAPLFGIAAAVVTIATKWDEFIHLFVG
jgi:hypothetical protein